MRIESFKGALLLALVIASIVALAIPLLSSTPVHAALIPHAPISIYGNDNFTTANGVVGGSGTENDSYTIENWDINASSANGIDIENTTAYFVIRNCLVENGGGAYAGISLDNAVNGKIENNTVGNNFDGIDFAYSDNNLISNNIVENNSYFGIYLKDSSNNTLTNNTCENNSYFGIWLSSFCSNDTLINNTCENNAFGIYLRSSAYDNLTNNTCKNNNFIGIYLDYYSDNNIIFSNNLENNSNGISIWDNSDNNIISTNLVKNNYSYGIYLTVSDNNRICHNNIISNATQANDSGSNHWDNGYPSSGNYWSNYTGVDENYGENQNIPGSDGIGDVPYNISGGSNRDRYPLMSPWQPSVVRGVSVSISPITQSGADNATLTYTVTVTNTGNVSDNYSLSVSDNASPSWSPSVDNTVLTGIAPSANKITTLRVTIPSNAVVGAIDNIKVIATSQTDNTVKDNNTCTALAVAAEVKLIAGWNLVGFKAVGASDTPNNVFTGLTYATDYYIYLWNSPGGPYGLCPPDAVFKDNTGYWILINQTWTATVP